METILTKNGNDIPFVTKDLDVYFIEGVEYTDDIDLLLNAIKNVKPMTYHEMCECFSTKDLDKASYWQYSFNYQWNNGGLILWHNPSEMWEHHEARQGKLVCSTCGSKKIMYYKTYCPKCDKPTADKKGRYTIHQIGYYLAAKHNLPERAIIDAITRSDHFEYSNDSPIDLYFTGDESVDKYLRLIDAEYPLETTNFFISW